MGAPLTYFPQGFGITNQARSCEVDILMNPFAQALHRASHILVIPNSKISIYSSLDFDGWMEGPWRFFFPCVNLLFGYLGNLLGGCFAFFLSYLSKSKVGFGVCTRRIWAPPWKTRFASCLQHLMSDGKAIHAPKSYRFPSSWDCWPACSGATWYTPSMARAMFSRWAKLISTPEGWSMGAISSANLRANWYTNGVPPPQLISHISPGVNIHPGDLQLSGCHGHRLFMGRGAPANAKMRGLRQVFACAGYFHSNICMPSLVDVALRLCIRHLAWSSVFGRLHLDHYSVFVLFIVDVPWHLNMRHKQKKLCRQYAQVMLRSRKRDTSYSKRDEGRNTWSHNHHSIHVHTQIWRKAFVLKQCMKQKHPVSVNAPWHTMLVVW